MTPGHASLPDEDERGERAETYRILAGIFAWPPGGDDLKSIKEDFGLKSKDDEYAVVRDFDMFLSLQDGLIPPVESIYVTEPGRTPAAEVLDFYAAADLSMDDRFEAIPDHIYIELMFVSYLVETGKKELQRKFFDEHVTTWMPYYLEGLIDRAETQFYREMAEITKDFIEGEYEELI